MTKEKKVRNQRFLGKLKLLMCPLTNLLSENEVHEKGGVCSHHLSDLTDDFSKTVSNEGSSSLDEHHVVQDSEVKKLQTPSDQVDQNENSFADTLPDMTVPDGMPSLCAPPRSSLADEYIPLPCICDRGAECVVISASLAQLGDSRSGYTSLPQFRHEVKTHFDSEVNRLREFFLQCLLPMGDRMAFDDSTEVKYIANHHFHPEIVSRSSQETKNCSIPMFLSVEEITGLSMAFSEKVRDEEGVATDYYFVLPNYSFEQTEQDLKCAQAGIRQTPVENKASSTELSQGEPLQMPKVPPTVAAVLSRDTPPQQCKQILFGQLAVSSSPEFTMYKQLFHDNSKDEVEEQVGGVKQKSSDNSNAIVTHTVEARQHGNTSGNPCSSATESLGSTQACVSPIASKEQIKERLFNAYQTGYYSLSDGNDKELPRGIPQTFGFNRVMNDKPSGMNKTLVLFESKRRSTYARKMASSALQWRSSLGLFQAGVNLTSNAEHWIYLVAATMKYLTKDEILCKEKSRDRAVLSFSTTTVYNIGKETKRVRLELHNQVESVRATVNTTITELEVAENSVSEAWDALNTAISANAIDRHNRGSFEQNSSCANFWDLQMRYCVSVAAQSSSWEIGLGKMSKLFECVRRTEQEVGVWLHGLLVEVVALASMFSTRITGIEKIEGIIKSIEEKLDEEAWHNFPSSTASF